MPRILVFDTTLRDGEQSPGSSMTSSEKLRMAHELRDLGVDVLEAGFAASSEGEARAIRRIAAEVRGVTVAALARAHEGDVLAAAESLARAERPRIHVFIATSELHLRCKLRMNEQECLERAAAAVEEARRWVDDVEFSAEDATRTDPGFLCRVVGAAVEAGASTVNIPDTVGYALPSEMSGTVRMLLARVPALADRVLSVHCHDDLGLAVANTLAAVEAGATQVECTVNGIGERAGNAALEEVVMALRVRAPQHTTGVHSERLLRASRLLSYLTGIHPTPNKAIVGRNAFAHEAGIHQHGVLEEPRTYEIMTPAMVGASASALVLGKHSGRHGLEARYRQLGYTLSDEELDRVLTAFKSLADRKKEVLDEDLISILHHGVMEDVPEHHALDALEVHCGGEVARARVRLSRRDEPHRPAEAEARGDGPIDAAFAALDALVDFKVVLQEFEIRAATPGEDAVGEVAIRALVDGQTFTGRGADTDVVRASAQAWLHAVNKAAQARVLEARHLARTADAWAV